MTKLNKFLNLIGIELPEKEDSLAQAARIVASQSKPKQYLKQTVIKFKEPRSLFGEMNPIAILNKI